MQYRQYFSGFAAVSILVTAPLAMSADTVHINITPKPGKVSCQSGDGRLGDASAKLELCVTQGNFAHDVYQVKIDGKAVLKGVDDDTTTGVSATYQGQKLSLICTPQNESPADVSAESIAAMQKMMPALSATDARAMVIRMKTVEVGRLCKAALGEQALFEAQVKFE